MDKFFIEPYTFEKVADKPLPQNILEWPSSIIQVLFNDYPELANFPYTVNFTSKDEKRGSAMGTVLINNVLNVPFVVDTFSLLPMLVGFVSGQDILQSMPLTKGFLTAVLAPQSFSKGLVNKKKNNNGRTLQASTYGYQEVKQASLLDTLNGSIRPEDKLNLLTKLAQDERLIASFASNGTSDVLEKVANLKVTENDTVDTVPENIFYIYKEAGLGYVKVSGNSEVYAPKKTALSEVDVKSGTSLMKTASKNNAIDFIKQASPTDVISYKGTDYKVIELDKTFSKEAHMLLSEDGKYINNFEKLAEWGYSSNQPSFNYTSTPQKGEYILVKTAENKFVGPVHVETIYSDKGQSRVYGSTGFTKVAFLENKNIDKSIYDSARNTVYVPKLETVKLAEKVDLVRPIEKIASVKHVVAKRSGEYYLVGPAFDKLASLSGNRGPFKKDEAVWNLIQVGASEDTIKRAEKMSRGEFYVPEVLEAPIEKKASKDEYDNSVKVVRSFIDSKFKGLLKEAASIADKSTLDVVLGLNLINEENLNLMVQNVALLDQALNMLARIWLLSCVGLKTFNLSSIELVMKRLGDIRDTLERLSYVFKNQ